MLIARTPDDLASWHGGVFVPTMGALHDGHVALVRDAVHRKAGDRIAGPVVVSIFVNPTQFNDKSDLARYPRTLDADLRACAAAGADVAFVPDESAIYPPGVVIPTPPLPDVAIRPGLEDALRPGHFAGVCQVVARLFDLVRPQIAVFGEKDWQQLQVIRAMVEDAAGRARRPRIVGVPTIREPDGLAMSSRNVFLSPDERRRAATINRALRLAQAQPEPELAERAMVHALAGAGLQTQYAVVRDARTLMPLDRPRPARALIAAKLGSVRLIDNAPWPEGA